MSSLLRQGGVVALFTILLSGCTFFMPDPSNEGTCRTLRSKIIFNGATTIDRQATIETTERDLQQHMYDKECAVGG